jgi:mycofactocin system FadH/OYE family oxidoreductase 2
MANDFTRLLSPIKIKNVSVRNRVVFLPHLTFYASENREPTERHRYYYAERARGGVGLIVTECQAVHPTGGHMKVVDASDRHRVLQWRDTISECRDHGAKIFTQLTHFGNQTFNRFNWLPLWAPSDIPDASVRNMPKAMEREDIEATVKSFAISAAYAREAGFDGVEIKVAHDGLLRQFLSPYFNRRADEYGGSAENRMRIVLEVLRSVRQAAGDDYPVGVRLSLDELIPGGYTLDDAKTFVAAFTGAGLVDYISGDIGSWMSIPLMVAPMAVPLGYATYAVSAIKEMVDIPVIAFGRINDPYQAETVLADGHADMIGMARQLLCDPEFVAKAKQGRADEIRVCVACNQECIGKLLILDAIGCIHNPAAGREKLLGHGTLQKASRPRHVVVVGGGPAGLKAAEIAAARGHQVTLMERAPELGGKIAQAAKAANREELGGVIRYLVKRTAQLGVRIRLGVDATKDLILSEHPDVVVVATGAAPGPPPFAITGRTPVLTDIDVLGGQEPTGKNVVLLDMDSHFQGGSIAETLAERNNRVRVITPAFYAGADIDAGSLILLRQRLAAKGVTYIADSTITEVGDGTVTVLDVLTGEPATLSGIETIVVAGNHRANNALYKELKSVIGDVHAIGDCVAPRRIEMAIYEGETIGRSL